ncbi:nicotinate (nicotinamide) nucleotide adenylyltransferase [Rhodoferax sp. PAMC 29310]|uniref:nicotinate (nicotinamide) nucleotide adenylyltransferase n=1 Tax=Rhodoferax sp. PAMC 29310 TaxID=2822760 RepID=UPI001B335F82|nr:nicotinate (nicotinamide) nucleotide adenylyltransferase [Rhodoferax sp. PAMC 29310]
MTDSASTPRRIGVFGGAFDPPHIAHAALVRAALDDLSLDELRLVPTGQAWHKARPLTQAEHRVAMCQLAFGHIPAVMVDTREIRRSGPSYTVDTLRELSAEFPNAELYLIIGGDQARALSRWHNWQEILSLAIICVAERGYLTGANPPFMAPIGSESRFRQLLLPVMPVSATEIRSRIAAQHSVATLVFEPVARYIYDHHLYQTI